jgi:hypothetical protein
MVFGGPGGNLIELPEPIDQTINDFRLAAGLAREQWQVQLGYNLSLFQNDVDTMVADDPLRITNAPSLRERAPPPAVACHWPRTMWRIWWASAAA